MKGVPLMPDYRDNPLDQEVNTEFMRVCKCVIPYLDTNIQRNVAIGLKFLELVNTINAFSETSTFSTNLSLTRQGHWEQDLLRNVRSNLSPEKAYIIDALIKLQEFRSILNIKEQQKSQTTNPSTPPNEFTNFSGSPSPPQGQSPEFEPFNPSDSQTAFEPFNPSDSQAPFEPFNSYDSQTPFGSFNSSDPSPGFGPFNQSGSNSYTNPSTSNNTTTNFSSHNSNQRPSNNGPSPANVLQMLSPLLDDNQKQMLNLFTSFLGNK